MTPSPPATGTCGLIAPARPTRPPGSPIELRLTLSVFIPRKTVCPAAGRWGGGEARGIATFPPSPPTAHASPPHPMPPHPSPLGSSPPWGWRPYKYLRCSALSLSKVGPGTWPPSSGVLTLAPSFCAPHSTPHPFIVNSHFCTGFEPGDVGSHFFSLCWHLRPLEAWLTSWFGLGEAQDFCCCCPLPCPPVLRISSISISLEGWAGWWRRDGKVSNGMICFLHLRSGFVLPSLEEPQ